MINQRCWAKKQKPRRVRNDMCEITATIGWLQTNLRGTRSRFHDTNRKCTRVAFRTCYQVRQSLVRPDTSLELVLAGKTDLTDLEPLGTQQFSYALNEKPLDTRGNESTEVALVKPHFWESYGNGS